jgi:hypothetical protein
MRLHPPLTRTVRLLCLAPLVLLARMSARRRHGVVAVVSIFTEVIAVPGSASYVYISPYRFVAIKVQNQVRCNAPLAGLVRVVVSALVTRLLCLGYQTDVMRQLQDGGRDDNTLMEKALLTSLIGEPHIIQLRECWYDAQVRRRGRQLAMSRVVRLG